jgi:ketosteroid isomerase-like protein
MPERQIRPTLSALTPSKGFIRGHRRRHVRIDFDSKLAKEAAMRNLALTICLGAVLVSVGSLPALAGKDLSKIKATIEAMSDELVQATLEGDVDTVMSYYTEDSVSMPNYHGILDGSRAIREYQENMYAVGIEFQSMDFTTLDLWKCGDLVYETGTFGISLTMPGAPEPVTDHGKYMTVWKRHRGGVLKIKTEIWNSDLNPWVVAAEQDLSSEAAKEYELLLKAKDTLEEFASALRKRAFVGLDGDWDDSVGGYRVSGFAEGTTAEDAGVREGDVLIEINGIPLTDREASQADAANRLPGREVDITVLREGSEQTMTVTLMAATEKMVAEEIGKFLLENYLD